MALTPKKVYAILKKYTDDSVAGGGAIKGKNCVITNITAITGGNRITFQWTLDNGTVQTDTLDVMNGTNGTNGTNGVGIASITYKGKDVDNSNIYTVTYTDGSDDDIVCPIGPQGPAGADGADGKDGKDGTDGVGVPAGGDTNQILRKKSGTDYDTEWVDPSASSQIQSDYGQTNSSAVDYIKNKPTLGTAAAKDSTNAVTQNSTDLVESGAVYAAISAIASMSFEVVSVLPTTDIKTDVIYLVPKTVGTSTTNIYDEYIYVNSNWELIGDTSIDLSGKADKVSGAVNGNLAGLDANGNLTDSTVVASKVIQKVTTATGLLKDDGTVDTTNYQKEITISNKKVIV